MTSCFLVIRCGECIFGAGWQWLHSWWDSLPHCWHHNQLICAQSLGWCSCWATSAWCLVRLFISRRMFKDLPNQSSQLCSHPVCSHWGERGKQTGSYGHFHLLSWSVSLRFLWTWGLWEPPGPACSSLWALLSIGALPTSSLLSVLLPFKMMQFSSTFPH